MKKIHAEIAVIGGGPAGLSAAAQAFIEFATSDAASELIVNAGAVPVAK